jgi:hypothetical protein
LKVKLSKFESQTFHDNDIELKQSKHTRLFHNIDKIVFFIFHKSLPTEIFRFKKRRCQS